MINAQQLESVWSLFMLNKCTVIYEITCEHTAHRQTVLMCSIHASCLLFGVICH